MTAKTYKFGRFTLDPAGRRLLKGKKRKQIRSKEFDLLHMLLEKHGRQVSKQDILDTVWHGTAVEEGTVSTNIRRIRVALGQRRLVGPTYIETITGVGYQFTYHVDEVEEHEHRNVISNFEASLDEDAEEESGHGRPLTSESAQPAPLIHEEPAFPRRHIKYANFASRSYGVLLALGLVLEASYAKSDFGVMTFVVAAGIAILTALITSTGLSLLRRGIEQDRPDYPFWSAFSAFAGSAVISWIIAFLYLGQDRAVKIIAGTTQPAIVALSVKYCLITSMAIIFMLLPYYFEFLRYKLAPGEGSTTKFFAYRVESALSPWLWLGLWVVEAVGISLWALRLGEKLGDAPFDPTLFLLIGIFLFAGYFAASLIAIFWYKSLVDQAP